VHRRCECGTGNEGVVDQGVVTFISCQRRSVVVCDAPVAVS
jgi:hypothetical protein